MKFPRSEKYDVKWIVSNQMGYNPLVLTEWSLQNIAPAPRSTVLDLACGRALSSIFLAKEYGCRVLAADRWVDPTDNQARIEEAGAAGLVLPLKADARELPFSKGYFDLIVCTDSFIYFGTDDLYVPYIREFLRPGGHLAFTVPGFPKDEPKKLPEHLRPFWADECWTWHNRDWWRQHLEKFGNWEVVEAELLPDGLERWMDWKRLRKSLGDERPSIDTDLAVMKKDGGKYMGFIKVVARRKEH